MLEKCIRIAKEDGFEAQVSRATVERIAKLNYGNEFGRIMEAFDRGVRITSPLAYYELRKPQILICEQCGKETTLDEAQQAFAKDRADGNHDASDAACPQCFSTDLFEKASDEELAQVYSAGGSR